jgi:hypothetical protein
MKNTNVEVEKESNAVLSKWSEELSEEQFNNFRFCFRSLEKDWFFDGFYPTINTELLMLIKEDFIKESREDDICLTADEVISIVKDYGSVNHSLMVDGEITYEPTDLSEYLHFGISAEKIEEIGVDEIKKWGAPENGFVRLEENLKSHSMMDDYPSGLENYVINGRMRSKSYSNQIYVSGVRFITKVDVSLPNREELLPE